MMERYKHSQMLIEQAILGNAPSVDINVIYDARLVDSDGNSYFNLFGNKYAFHHSAIRRGYVRKFRAEPSFYSGHFGTGITVDLNNYNTRTFIRNYYIRED